jgi:hypothetical protein
MSRATFVGGGSQRFLRAVSVLLIVLMALACGSDSPSAPSGGGTGRAAVLAR